jgi:hypothetical protein
MELKASVPAMPGWVLEIEIRQKPQSIEIFGLSF